MNKVLFRKLEDTFSVEQYLDELYTGYIKSPNPIYMDVIFKKISDRDVDISENHLNMAKKMGLILKSK